MGDNRIQTGSKELACERKLVREIIELLALELNKCKYQFRRSEEVFGGYSNGYRAEYILIESKPKDRIRKSFKLRIETQGFDWDHRNDLERVSVSVWGGISTQIKQPREAVVDRPIHGVSCSFNRNRPRHVQAKAVVRLIDQQLVEYYKMLARVEASVVEWDKFARLFDRVKKALNIPASQVWRSHHANCTVVELSIPETKNRNTSAKVLVNKCGDLDLMISDLTEQKLQRIVKIIRS